MGYYEDDNEQDQQDDAQSAIDAAVEAARAAQAHLEQVLQAAQPKAEPVLTPEDIETETRRQAAFGGVAAAAPYSNDHQGRADAAAAAAGPNASFEDVIAALKAQGVPVESIHS